MSYSDEADWREMQRDKADREKHLADLRAASAKREELIAIIEHEITSARRHLHEQETKLAEEQRQLALDAETIAIVERYHGNPGRVGEALNSKPFHRPAREAINELRLHHMHAAGQAGARVSDAQHDGTPEELAAAWADYSTHTEVSNDIGRLMGLMGAPLALVDVDTAYPEDGPAAGSLKPRSSDSGQEQQG